MGVIKTQYSIGWCLNPKCNEFNKAVFLTTINTPYICWQCRHQSFSLSEKQWPERYDSLDFYQVRLEYDYYAPEARWLGLCIITDESADKKGNVWYIQNPNIKTEKHAKKSATDALAFLQRADESVLEPGICIRNSEMVLDIGLSREAFKADLNRTMLTLRRSRLCADQNGT